MKTLVTGGAGFIGSHLVEALIRRGHAVRVLDDFSAGNIENLRAVRNRIELIRGDIRSERTLKKALRGVQVVFHQAALRSVPKSVEHPALYHEVNVTGTFHLLRLALAAGVRRVVYASSSSVYGDAPLPQQEAFECRPQSPYAASKLAGEVYARMFTRLYGLPTVGLRYFNVFGPRQSIESEYAVVVPKFITRLLRNLPPPIHGNGRQTRDFTYVGNVVQANLLAARVPGAVGEVFNIASGTHPSVLTLARLLKEKIGADAVPCFLKPRPGDVRHTWADIGKAGRLLKFRPAVSFEEGLYRTLDWFDRNRSFWAR